MQTRFRMTIAGVVVAMGIAVLGACASLDQDAEQGNETVVLECRYQQDLDMILLSPYGEPPQIAVWLEDPDTGELQTVFVTYRSATGDWVGKLECPAALPRWFSVYQEEFDVEGLPTPDQPLADGLSGATPKDESFAVRTDVPKGSRWIVWVEVNLAADYNAHFPPPGTPGGAEDTHHDGQPSVLYRGKLHAVPGEQVEPELWAYSRRRTTSGELERDLSPITTPRDILTALEVKIVKD